jgi:hypothetical protein
MMNKLQRILKETAVARCGHSHSEEKLGRNLSGETVSRGRTEHYIGLLCVKILHDAGVCGLSMSPGVARVVKCIRVLRGERRE